jgi:F-type H+-transporting ATPase subunit b
VKLCDGARKRLWALWGTLGAFVLCTPTLAFAEEAAANEENPLSLLIPNPGEFIPMLVGFLALWAILAKFAWPTITGMLDKRVTTIRESLEKAESARLESERLLEEQKAQLEEARKQATQIIADAKATGDAVRADMMEQAKEDARMLVERANAAIETEKNVAIAQLQSSVADLSVAVAGRVIGQDLSDGEHRKIIEHYLAQAGSFDDN